MFSDKIDFINSICVLAGNLNVRLDRDGDRAFQQFNDVMQTFGLQQHVEQPTHDCGGLLDAIKKFELCECSC